VCGSSARTDLYGGQLAIAVPTVTEITPRLKANQREGSWNNFVVRTVQTLVLPLAPPRPG
jgi:hypothetical protein